MNGCYPIKLIMECYTFMISFLSHFGHLDEVKELKNRIPIKSNAIVWIYFHDACRINNNIK